MNSFREAILRGERPAIHPVHHALVQLWAAWRKTEMDLNPNAKPPGLEQFASAVGTTVRYASRQLRGTYKERDMRYGTIESWTRGLQDHWTSRGIEIEIWTVRRPSGRYSIILKGPRVRPW